VHARRWAILAVLCLSVFIALIDNTIVNVALPSISRQLHAATSDLQWIVDAYSLVFASLLLVGGSLGDRYGRKGALQAGLAAFAGFSAFAGLSGSTQPAAELGCLRRPHGRGSDPQFVCLRLRRGPRTAAPSPELSRASRHLSQGSYHCRAFGGTWRSK
jgi:MFS family permease